jgi:hypothetical protein
MGGDADPGPVNIDQARHRDLLVPPSTDHGTLPNLRKQNLGNPG